MDILEKALNSIGDLDNEAIRRAKERLDNLTKPPGSLGVLEDLAVKLAGMSGKVFNEFKKKTVIVMAGDHGVVEEGVSAYPREVTPQMVLNFLKGGAAMSVLSRHGGAEIVCVDIGVAADLDHPKLVTKKIKKGTDNMAKGPAMSREEAVKALEVGISTAWDCIDKGSDLLATGEMGIGNTTPSTAILAAFSGKSLEEIVGRGSGVDDGRLAKKISAIKKAHRRRARHESRGGGY